MRTNLKDIQFSASKVPYGAILNREAIQSSDQLSENFLAEIHEGFPYILKESDLQIGGHHHHYLLQIYLFLLNPL